MLDGLPAYSTFLFPLVPPVKPSETISSSTTTPSSTTSPLLAAFSSSPVTPAKTACVRVAYVGDGVAWETRVLMSAHAPRPRATEESDQLHFFPSDHTASTEDRAYSLSPDSFSGGSWNHTAVIATIQIHNPTSPVPAHVAAICTHLPHPPALPIEPDRSPLHDGVNSRPRTRVDIVSRNAWPEISKPLCHLGFASVNPGCEEVG